MLQTASWFPFKLSPRQCTRLTSSMDACVSSVETRKPSRSHIICRCSPAPPCGLWRTLTAAKEIAERTCVICELLVASLSMQRLEN